MNTMEKKDNQTESRAEIRIRVGLDDKKIPVSLEWMAEDNPQNQKFQPVRALMISLFDHQSYDTLRIDLWTKDMEVGQMDRFIYQSLKGMADSYARATGNKELANDMQKFTVYFGEKVGLLKQE